MPEGFQVIEEMIFPVLDTSVKSELLRQAKLLHSNVSRLQNAAAVLQTTDSHIFDALRLELFRIISLGISDFDSPVAQNSIAEARASLSGIENYFSFYVPHLEQKDKQGADKLVQLFSTAKQFLSSTADFISFDRMQFIRQYANPLSENLLAAQKILGFSLLNEPRALRQDAKNLFAENIFNADFYAPGEEAHSTPAKLALGTKLFYDPVLSGNGSRSCASCHQPDKGFADAMKTNLAFNRTLSLRRNTPGLLNAGLQPALFYDTRVTFLEDQAKTVITNKDEMHGSFEKAKSKLKTDAGYKKLFAKAYKDEEVSEQHIKNAIAIYVRSLVALNSRFDKYMRGQNNAMNRIEIDGFNLFMGKAKCGTCHFAPLFNGSNPPNFTKIDAEVIGVPANADTNHPRLDKDEGKYNVNGIELYRGAFKTPTVRNSALTAPYMHNGVFNTLDEVIEFYNRGGGKGLGLPIENQTLPEDRLNLSVYEKNAIIAFIKSLNDTDSFKK
jgi:cytochrome c peroxidase